MIRASSLISTIAFVIYWALALFILRIARRVTSGYSKDLCNWSYEISCTIPKQNKETKKKEKFRSKKNQIQSHLFTIFNIDTAILHIALI